MRRGLKARFYRYQVQVQFYSFYFLELNSVSKREASFIKEQTSQKLLVKGTCYKTYNNYILNRNTQMKAACAY